MWLLSLGLEKLIIIVSIGLVLLGLFALGYSWNYRGIKVIEQKGIIFRLKNEIKVAKKRNYLRNVALKEVDKACREEVTLLMHEKDLWEIANNTDDPLTSVVNSK